MSILDSMEVTIPTFFEKLLAIGVISRKDIAFSGDGFYSVTKSIASILISKGIDTYPDNQDKLQECRYFFDDWFLYAVSGKAGYTYSLFKMREQEFDAEKGLVADGDTPGVTISFVAFESKLFENCLLDPLFSNRKTLGNKINRVVAYRKQVHHSELKAYFIRPEAKASYLICELYTRYIASFVEDGILNVPIAYQEVFKKKETSKKYARLPDFIEQNNREANILVCDHEKIYIKDPNHLSRFEKLAILATHTGNVSFHSFAAEVRYHTMYLTDMAKIRMPLVGSPYASAIRADMSIGDKEFQGPTPYYNSSSKLVIEQTRYHMDI